MTIAVANTANTEPVSAWRTRTNEIAAALSTKVLTTDSNVTTGNSAVNGTFTATTLTANSMGGGNTSVAANLTFTTNVNMTARANLGFGANVMVVTGNSTFRVLLVNSSNYSLFGGKIMIAGDVSDANVSSPANTHVLVYDTDESAWKNKASNTLSANDSINLNGQAASYYTNATNMGSGTLPSGRLAGSYTGVTALGTLTTLSVTGNTATGKLTVTGNASVSKDFTVTGNTVMGLYVELGRFFGLNVATSSIISPMDIGPQNSVQSGGEIRLRGANTGTYDVVLDVSATNFRIQTMDKGSTSNSAVILGFNVSKSIQINGAHGANGNFLRSYGSGANTAWANIVATDVSDSTSTGRAVLTASNTYNQTILFDSFVGDSGSGGKKGVVPAPSSGDAAAGKKLSANGSWTAGYSDYEVGTLAVSTLYTQAHGLGRLPGNFLVLLRCDTTDAGYDAGDYIVFQNVSVNNGYGGTFGANTSHVFAVTGSTYQVKNKSSGATDNLVVGNWTVIARVYE